MKPYFTYTFDLDSKVLYRNEVLEDGKFKYSPYKGGDDEFQPTVAYGFTAYLMKDIHYIKDENQRIPVIEECGRLALYDAYSKHAIDKIRHRLLNDRTELDEEKATEIATSNLLEIEKDYLEESKLLFQGAGDDVHSSFIKKVERHTLAYLKYLEDNKQKAPLLIKAKEISDSVLHKIYDVMVDLGLVAEEERVVFMSLFSKPKGKVHYNPRAMRGGKPLLFRLMRKITTRHLMAAEMKLYFESSNHLHPIHDNWLSKEKNTGSLKHKELAKIFADLPKG